MVGIKSIIISFFASAVYVGLGEKTEELINKKSEREGNTTPWEQYLQKKKEKRKQKKESRNKTDTQNDSQTGVPTMSCVFIVFFVIDLFIAFYDL